MKFGYEFVGAIIALDILLAIVAIVMAYSAHDHMWPVTERDFMGPVSRRKARPQEYRRWRRSKIAWTTLVVLCALAFPFLVALYNGAPR